MKSTLELYKQLQSGSFEQCYPLQQEENNKVKILFVAPFLSGTGYYRSILPLLELNKTDSHCAIITEINKPNFAVDIDEFIFEVDPDLIKWTDYIVLPRYCCSLKRFIDAAKAINPNVQFVMDMDTNYHALPEIYPGYDNLKNSTHKKLGNLEKRQQVLLSNIASMDLLLGVTNELLDYYEELLDEHYPNSGVRTEYLPNLISDYNYENIDEIQKNAGEKIRIGLIGKISTYYDIVHINDVLKEVSNQYEDKIEIILFGWDGKDPSGKDLLDGVKFTSIKSVNFADYRKYKRLMKGYFTVLNELQLDIALLPMLDIPCNTHGKSPIKYLEQAAFSVPVVASDIEPYQSIIQHGKTGFLASSKEQWVKHIGSLVESKELRSQIATTANKFAWKEWSYTSANLDLLKDIFI